MRAAQSCIRAHVAKTTALIFSAFRRYRVVLSGLGPDGSRRPGVIVIQKSFFGCLTFLPRCTVRERRESRRPRELRPIKSLIVEGEHSIQSDCVMHRLCAHSRAVNTSRPGTGFRESYASLRTLPFIYSRQLSFRTMCNVISMQGNAAFYTYYPGTRET